MVEIKVLAYIGAKYGSFPIDLATDLHLVSPPERLQPRQVVEVPGLQGLPEIFVYPLDDQVADKLCAMYELHGAAANPSSRFRDLIDLALITSSCELDGQQLAAAVSSERQRRQMQLPIKLIVPGPGWPAGFASTARRSPLSFELRQIDAALALVARCLDPILAGERSTGTWNPTHGWVDSPVRDEGEN